jgi:UDP-N-acetylglucosamine diphosphorylase/glucosamine-1-phosphate N-acetyltransferase
MKKDGSDTAVIILAAGLGTRMKSNKAKVLHEILGRPMISYVVETARAVAGKNVVLVIGHQADRVKTVVAKQADVQFAYQEKQLGTGHAVLCAMPVLHQDVRHVMILCGDVPLLGPKTLHGFVNEHRSQKRVLSVLAVHLSDPKGYGRIVRGRGGNVIGIVEEADATPNQKAIQLINTGIYCVDRDFLGSALQQIRADNTQGEYYLTDIVELAHQADLPIGVTMGENADEFMGINSREQLEAVQEIMRTAPKLN